MNVQELEKKIKESIKSMKTDIMIEDSKEYTKKLQAKVEAYEEILEFIKK